jgi:DNA-directed RNA polymerase subunit RPC12/RpoP
MKITTFKPYEDPEANAFECKNCGFVLQLSDGDLEENNYNYCPHCGARIVNVEEGVVE